MVAIVRSDATLDEARLRFWCSERLIHYQQPRTLLFVDGLPRNSLGKVLRPASWRAAANLSLADVDSPVAGSGLFFARLSGRCLDRLFLSDQVAAAAFHAAFPPFARMVGAHAVLYLWER